MGLYTLGTEVTMFHTFTLDDVPTNPTTVVVTVELPDETTETFVFGVDPEVTNPSAGYFELAYQPPMVGTYNYQAAGGGAVAAVSATGSFTVLADAISSELSGPCEAWISGDDVAECCDGAISSTPSELFEQSAFAAQEALYVLSGRIFSGTCERTVRPCRTGCSCGVQILSRGHIIWSGEAWDCMGDLCGCGSLSQVKLADHPVRAISQVKIDGSVISSSEYRLDEGRYLTRLNGDQWPSCQRLDLADTQGGTFSVTYLYGQEPPEIGKMAAGQLACELYRACSGDAECVLPSGVSRITRQNVTIEFNAFAAWGRQEGIWRTGLSLVDLFLNTYNPRDIRKRTNFITPGRRPWPMNA